MTPPRRQALASGAGAARSQRESRLE
jgi:hypothetical protein